MNLTPKKKNQLLGDEMCVAEMCPFDSTAGGPLPASILAGHKKAKGIRLEHNL